MVIKNKFFDVELPVIGEKIKLIAKAEEELNNKRVKIDLTRKLRGKSIEIIFKITVKDKKITAEPVRLSLLGYFIRRMIRKSTNYVEDSFTGESKDSILRIKPFLITRQKVSRAIRNNLRNKTKEDITETIKNMSVEEIFTDIIFGKFQKNLSLKLKKIYPLALCEIREIFIEKSKFNQIITEEKIK